MGVSPVPVDAEVVFEIVPLLRSPGRGRCRVPDVCGVSPVLVQMWAGACTVIVVIGSVSAAMIAAYAGADCASKAAVAACGRHTRLSMAPSGLEMSPPPGPLRT